MDELDTQIANVEDVTSVLSNPLQSSQDDVDLEAELDWLEAGGQDTDQPRPLPAIPQAHAQAHASQPPAAEVTPPSRENAMADLY